MSGFASRNGFEDRPPVLPPLAMADMSLLESLFSILGPEAAIHRLSRRV